MCGRFHSLHSTFNFIQSFEYGGNFDLLLEEKLGIKTAVDDANCNIRLYNLWPHGFGYTKGYGGQDISIEPHALGATANYGDGDNDLDVWLGSPYLSGFENGNSFQFL